MMHRRFLISLVLIGGLITCLLDPVTDVSQAQDCQACAQRAGKIEGRVLDAQGSPIAGANVYAVIYNFESGSIPTAETDRNGYFSLIVGPGLYRIYSGKISSGYPEDLASIYQDAVRHLDVQVIVDKVISGLELRLGPQLGKLSGRIVDVSNKRAITDASVTLRLVENPNIFYRTNADEKGRFRFLAPPVPFTVEVSAPGYEKKRLEALLLMRGEVKRLNIALHPAR